MEGLKIQFEPDSVKGLTVEFYRKKRLNQKLADETGEEHYAERIYIRTKVAGSKYDINERIAKLPEDKMKFPDAWRAFETGSKEGRFGTPLQEIDGFTGDIIQKLHAAHVYNVEALRDLHDGAMNTLGRQARVWVKMAKDTLDRKDAEAKAPILQSQLHERDKVIEELTARLAAVETEQRRGPGRPRKEATDEAS